MKELALWKIDLAVERVICKHEHEILIEAARKASIANPLLGAMYCGALAQMMISQANRLKDIVARGKRSDFEAESPSNATPSKTITISGDCHIFSGKDLRVWMDNKELDLK